MPFADMTPRHHQIAAVRDSRSAKVFELKRSACMGGECRRALFTRQANV